MFFTTAFYIKNLVTNKLSSYLNIEGNACKIVLINNEKRLIK